VAVPPCIEGLHQPAQVQEDGAAHGVAILGHAGRGIIDVRTVVLDPETRSQGEPEVVEDAQPGHRFGLLELLCLERRLHDRHLLEPTGDELGLDQVPVGRLGLRVVGKRRG